MRTRLLEERRPGMRRGNPGAAAPDFRCGEFGEPAPAVKKDLILYFAALPGDTGTYERQSTDVHQNITQF